MSERYKDEEWLREQYLEMGKSMHQIAEENNANNGTIWYYCNKYNIETRDRKQAAGDAVRVEYANYYTNNKGYPLWKTSVGGGKEKICYVARLLAVAEYGFDAVKNKEVHHINEIPWDNRPENLQPLDVSKHRRKHNKDSDSWASKDTPWRDERTLRDLYVRRKWSTKQIGESLGCAASTINRWLGKHGIDKRKDYHRIQ